METKKAEIIVMGGGPAGYAAAFHAADLGKDVLLIDQAPQLGGACLHRGCIPSKALLHATEILSEVQASGRRGICFGEPRVDLNQLRQWKNEVIETLSKGLDGETKKRGIRRMNGRCMFENSNRLRIETRDGQRFVDFDRALIAVGAKPILPRTFDLGNPRIMTSREALDIPDIPTELLIIGGGYIGMEMAFIYARLGSRVTLLEAMDSILLGADPDLLHPIQDEAKKQFKDIRLKTKATKMETAGKRIKVQIQDNQGRIDSEVYDRVLVAVGRKPNTDDLGLDNTKVELDQDGFIKTDDSFVTQEETISAIGDCVGGLLLAHKAEYEARLAVDAMLDHAGLESRFTPSVVFTDPEIAWVGLTESEARSSRRNIQVSKVHWKSNGRALTLGHTNGMTKLVYEKDTERLLGIGITGNGAGELIGEAVLALEMGATLFDLSMTMHPHPTLSETLPDAARREWNRIHGDT